jgi:phenylacetate-CoA ligase
MQDYTRLLNRFKPRYLYGYVSMLAAYAEFLQSTGTGLKFDLQAVVTTSEVLTPSHRQLFREVFRTNVYNEYGCGELGTIAHECEKGRMHINAENLVVEILDGERPCVAGEIGELVMTDLNNEGMPLIRYRLGDFGSFSETPCECGRGLPVIRDIVGRAYDLVYNREGKIFHGEFFMYIFEEAKKKGLGVRAFQVVQEDYDNFNIKIQPHNGYGRDTEQLIKDRIWQGYGRSAKINFTMVDEITREKSGKMRLIVGCGRQSRPEQ